MAEDFPIKREQERTSLKKLYLLDLILHSLWLWCVMWQSQGYGNLHGEKNLSSTSRIFHGMKGKRRTHSVVTIKDQRRSRDPVPKTSQCVCFQFCSLWHRMKHLCFGCWHFILSACGTWKLESIKTIKQSSVQFIDDGIWQTHHTTQTEMETVVFFYFSTKWKWHCCVNPQSPVFLTGPVLIESLKHHL